MAGAKSPSPFLFMILDKLVSAIKNDLYGGLKGMHTNLSISDEQLADDIIDERLQIIKEYQLKGILPLGDLLLSINCIPVDCKDIEKCSKCKDAGLGTPTAHFEIPQIITDYGSDAIQYIGTIDKTTPFTVYTSLLGFTLYHRYKRRGKMRPYVWVDVTPNENGMYDAFIFNAPLIKKVSITAVFKDPRQLEQFGCCEELNDDNFSWINNEIKKRLTQKKLAYYRQYSPQKLPNDQSYN